MRSLVICGACALTVMLSAAPAMAQWCARYQTGGSNCYFTSQAQCMAALSGNGGSCSPDGSARPAAAVQSDAPARPARRAEPKKREAVRQRPAAPAPAAPVPAVATPSAPVATPTAASAAPAAGGMAANFAAARQLVLDGKYQAGLAALQSLGFDDHPEIATLIGFAHNKLGRPDQARGWYDKALAANPNHLLTLSFSGMLHADRGNLRGAQADLEKLKRLCGDCNESKALEAVLAAKPR